MSADFVGVAFLDLGRTAAGAVGRVARPDGSPWGSGFLVANRLFLTNNHVIANPLQADEFVVEFEYELDTQRRTKTPTRFRFAPENVFLTSNQDDLDFTLIAIGSRIDGPRSLEELGYCLLSESPDRHTIGEYVNIIQHPDGRYKEIVLRENRLVWRSDNVLHYIADTQPGSSGSPVFNDQWQPIALHHWGGPHRDLRDADGRLLNQEINEGLRISAIVKTIRSRAGLQGNQLSLVDVAISQWSGGDSRPVHSDAARSQAQAPSRRPQVDSNGQVTWTIPLTVSIGLGCPTEPTLVTDAPQLVATPVAAVPDAPHPHVFLAEEAVLIDPQYGNRGGYDRNFLAGFAVDLPKWNERHFPAPRTDSPLDSKIYILDYEHFSIVLNRKRRMANFTVVNIDGKRSRRVNRRTGQVAEAAEASEVWYADPRVADDHQTNQLLYANQSPTRLFDRGHLVRREDPNWGSDTAAERANADTFHFTNCTPQARDFNQRAKYWQGIENYVLNNARAEKERITVITGSVFTDEDPEYRFVKVPRQFWKILVRVEDGELHATALLADQSAMLRHLPERYGRIAEDLITVQVAESFADLGNVAEYQTTVAHIEQLTGLDFGELGDHDTAEDAGEAIRGEIESYEAIRLKPSTAASRRREAIRKER
jgi:endonuclease G, mitochondrial